MKTRTVSCVFVLAFVVAGLASFAQTGIDAPDFQARRKAALEKVPDGIILLRSSWGLKHWDESGFHQDPSFYYFTGLANAHGAIVALDGTQKESWLFVPPRIPLGADLHGFDAVFFDPGSQTEAELKFDHVVPLDQLSLSWTRAARAIPSWLPTSTREVKLDRCQAIVLLGSLPCWAPCKTPT